MSHKDVEKSVEEVSPAIDEVKVQEAITLLKDLGFKVNKPGSGRKEGIIAKYIRTKEEINSHGIKQVVSVDGQACTVLDLQGNEKLFHKHSVYSKLKDFEKNGVKAAKVPKYKIIGPEDKVDVAVAV